MGDKKDSKLQIENQVRYLFNIHNMVNAQKKRLESGTQKVNHEFDLYEQNKVVGGISTSPWLNKTQKKSSNSGGQDRAATELLWLSLWDGIERRVLVLTERDMAANLIRRWNGCSFPHQIEIIYCDLSKKGFEQVGVLKCLI